jgi:hypothetical protein
MSDKPKCLLDVVPDGPVYSDVFEFGKPARRYKFRLLDSMEQLWANVAAQRRTMEFLKEQFNDEDTALDLMKNHGPNADLHVVFEELYALQAALCDEKGAPACDGNADQRVTRLADVFSVVERFELARMYGEFSDGHDPMQFDDEDIQEIIAKGDPTAGTDYWSQYGLNTLRRCAHTLACHLMEANHRIRQLEHALVEASAEPGTSPMPRSGDGSD